MESVEMKTMAELSKLTEKFADFAGNIIMQILQKQGYVEQQGIKALLNHVRDGGMTNTTTVSEARAGEFKEMLKKAHIPFVEIEHVDPQTKERMIFFVYRDIDVFEVKNVIKQFQISLDKECHEVDLDTFEQMMEQKPYASLYQLSKEELYAFKEAAKDYDFLYSVIADGDKYGIVGSNKEQLRQITSDMCYNLSGNRGKQYEASLSAAINSQNVIIDRMRPEPGKVNILVSATNPENFITVDEQGITTHSIGSREERGRDGSVKKVLYDAHHVTYPGYDSEKLKILAAELHRPMILAKDEFPLIVGISKTKEAQLSKNFEEAYVELKAKLKDREADFINIPKRVPLYTRENLIAYSNIPEVVLSKLEHKNLPEVYIYGSDVAYPKELEEEMKEFWDQELYEDPSVDEKVREQEKYESKDYNAALEYMLSIEKSEKAVLKAKNIIPGMLNDEQKAAFDRMKSKEIKEQIMNKDMAKMLQDHMRDRRIQMEIER